MPLHPLAFIGITIALIGGKGYEIADDWAALIASVLIFYNAIQLLRPGLAEIMDAAPSAEIVQKVRELAAQIKEVKFIEKCYVRKMGFDYFADLNIQVDDLVKNKLLQSDLGIKDASIHIEPFAVCTGAV
jgi:divalent metal cation (Fe/Co/Zn/Cd) transporter